MYNVSPLPILQVYPPPASIIHPAVVYKLSHALCVGLQGRNVLHSLGVLNKISSQWWCTEGDGLTDLVPPPLGGAYLHICKNTTYSEF